MAISKTDIAVSILAYTLSIVSLAFALAVLQSIAQPNSVLLGIAIGIGGVFIASIVFVPILIAFIFANTRIAFRLKQMIFICPLAATMYGLMVLNVRLPNNLFYDLASHSNKNHALLLSCFGAGGVLFAVFAALLNRE